MVVPNICESAQDVYERMKEDGRKKPIDSSGLIMNLPVEEYINMLDKIRELNRKAVAYDILIDKAKKNFGGFPMEALLCCDDAVIEVETFEDFGVDFLNKALHYNISVKSFVSESDIKMFYGIENKSGVPIQWKKIFEEKEN